MEQTYMKEKPIFGLMLSMALPMVLSMMVNSLYNIVDSFFVAKISENAMTALSLVYPVQNLISAVSIGFGVGINAVIAFYLGAREQERADGAASQGMLLSLIHGAVMMAASILVMPMFLRMFTTDGEVVDLGLRYSNIAFSFSIIIAAGLAYEKIFQAVGRMAVTMVCLMGGCIANIILDPVLIFGLGPIPAMGIEGAALATGIGQTLTLAMYLIFCMARPLPLRIRIVPLQLEKDMCRRLYSVGLPSALSLSLPSLMISSLNVILARYGTLYVFVLGVYYKLQTFLYLPANGIVQGMRPLIGYNYGAGEKKRVNDIFLTALGMSAVIMVVGILICQMLPEALIGLFTTSQDTIQAGAGALRIISLGFLVSTISVTTSGALEGLGKGAPSLFISLLRYVAVIIPAAGLLSALLGASGVWHAFWVTEMIAAAASWQIYRRIFR